MPATGPLSRLSDHDRDRTEEDQATPLRLLAVGDVALLGQAPLRAGLDVLDFDDATPDVLAAFDPDVVLSPLVAPRFDCYDLACRLSEAGFRGRYRAAAARIPNPALVAREVRASFPGLDFDIFVFGEAGPGGVN